MKARKILFYVFLILSIATNVLIIVESCIGGDNSASQSFSFSEAFINMLFGYCETLCSYDTHQFNDYSKYDCDMFDAEHKAEVRDNEFPKDLAKAYDLGKRLAEMNI